MVLNMPIFFIIFCIYEKRNYLHSIALCCRCAFFLLRLLWHDGSHFEYLYSYPSNQQTRFHGFHLNHFFFFGLSESAISAAQNSLGVIQNKLKHSKVSRRWWIDKNFFIDCNWRSNSIECFQLKFKLQSRFDKSTNIRWVRRFHHRALAVRSSQIWTPTASWRSLCISISRICVP